LRALIRVRLFFFLFFTTTVFFFFGFGFGFVGRVWCGLDWIGLDWIGEWMGEMGVMVGYICALYAPFLFFFRSFLTVKKNFILKKQNQLLILKTPCHTPPNTS
jgi:hypothetical protein